MRWARREPLAAFFDTGDQTLASPGKRVDLEANTALARLCQFYREVL